ncbi:laccase domain-containing protein [Candidatus Uhrbacteria bacterium]|nr:laccase domain-containing protein [Candidatus Uhrbacteria bacterium]
MKSPAYVKGLWHGDVLVAVFGTVRNWNFAGETPEAIEANNPGVSADIAEVMDQLEIHRALVPRPAFHAMVCEPSQLTVERLPRFFRGVDADGVLLTESGDAYILASADCLTTVVYDCYQHTLVALHCGRNALIDRERLAGKPPRQYASVIEAGLDALNRYARVDPSKLLVFLAAGIGPETFVHPTTEMVPGPDGNPVPNKYAAANAQLIRHLTQKYAMHAGQLRDQPPIVTDSVQGKIDLVALAKVQLWKLGIPFDNMVWDGFDTATSSDGSEPLFHSNRRNALMRNLVVVKLN